MTSAFKPPEELDFKEPKWEEWKQRFEAYRLITELQKKDEIIQVETLKYCMGAQCVKIMKTMNLSEADLKSYDAVMKKFDQYFKPRRNEIRLRRNFHRRIQETNESIEEFLTDLYAKSEECKFSDSKERIRDQFLAGLNNEDLLEKLELLYFTNTDNFNMDVIIEYCRTYCDVKKSRNSSEEIDHTINKVKASSKYSGNRTKNCKYCGKTHLPRNCPAYGKTCEKCKKQNHFSSVCLTRPHLNQFEQSSDRQQSEEDKKILENSSENETVFLGQCDDTSKTKWRAKVCVGKSENVLFTVDTGADVTVISANTYMNFEEKPVLSKCNRTFRSPGGIVEMKGMFKTQLKYRNKEIFGEIYVQNSSSSPNLLSNIMSEKLGLVQFLGKIVDEEIFGFGKWETQPVSFKLRKDADPYALHAARNVPIPILKSVKKTLDEMESSDIIEKVTHPTLWVSPMVPVKKRNSDQIRICVDYKKLNFNLIREKYPIPTFEELSFRFDGSRYFSKVDASSGFFQIPLAEDARDYTTFITPFGRYRFLRLPMGINIAPEIFQRKINELAEGLEGVIGYMDDIVVHGATEEEHDHRLQMLLKRIKDSGLKLNQEKCEFKRQNIEFLGHVISTEGIKIDPKKINAINRIRRPNNVDDLRKFLGMLNFLTKFIPKAQEIVQPLNILLRKDIAWTWGPTQEESFGRIKQMLTDAPVLSYYNSKRETVLSVDASSFGMGGVLLQKHEKIWKPVAYCSRTLTKTEQNWAQIEKELLAAVFSSEKFHIFLCGLDYTIETDHKPLVSIINKKDLNEAPARCQRMLMRLARYSPIAKYTPGKYLSVADALSRLPQQPDQVEVDKFTNLINDVEDYIGAIVSHLPMSDKQHRRLKEAQYNEEQLLFVIKYYERNGTDEEITVKDNEYFAYGSDFSVSPSGLILYRSRIVIPPPLRKEMLRRIHDEGHLSLSKCRERLQSTIWWPGIATDLKKWIERCDFCQINRRKNRAEPMIPSDLPERPWMKIGIDLFEFQGNMFLVVIDYFSKWIEMPQLQNSTSSTVILHLKNIFSRFGLPTEIRSDGGRQFTSSEFFKFCEGSGILHTKSSPYHPQGNGAAERAVQTCKRILKQKDPLTALLAYRSTPVASTGFAPSQLLMGRALRTTLPSISSNLDPKWPEMEQVRRTHSVAKEKSSKNYNRVHGAKPLKPIQPGTYVRMKTEKDSQWSQDTYQTNAQISERKYLLRNRRNLQVCPQLEKSLSNQLHTSTTTSQPSVPAPNGNHVIHDPPDISSNPEPYITRYGRQVKPTFKI